MRPPVIASKGKAEEAGEHHRWLKTLKPTDILVYTDGSKGVDGLTASAWHWRQVGEDTSTVLFEGACQIGKHCDIEDGEIHAIQEALDRLKYLHLREKDIYLCVDNQNPIKALAGGPTAGRAYVMKCLEDVATLQQKGCNVTGKWTPSHEGIPGNERADTLAKEGTKLGTCIWARVTLTWLRSQPHGRMID